MKLIFVFLTVFIFTTNTLQAQKLQKNDITVLDKDSVAVSISSLVKNKPALIVAWSASCTSCKIQMTDFEKNISSKDYTYITINMDSFAHRQNAEKLYSQHKFTAPLYFDNNFQAMEKLMIMQFPSTVLVKPDGSVTPVLNGYAKDDYKVITRKVNNMLKNKGGM